MSLILYLNLLYYRIVKPNKQSLNAISHYYSL